MKKLLFHWILLCIGCIGFSQPSAFLLQQKSHEDWDTICVFSPNDIAITHAGELEFLNPTCLPVAACPRNSIFYFVFPNHTYFLIETQTILSSVNSNYPCIQIHLDSIRNQRYLIDTYHFEDTAMWHRFVAKWNTKEGHVFRNEEPIAEIGTAYVVYKGDTLNLYDDSCKKNGKWIAYHVNNPFRKDSLHFFLPYDISVLAVQHFEHGNKTDHWKGFYNNGNICYSCTFVNDSLVEGLFYGQNGKVRYKYLSMDNDTYVLKDYMNRRNKMRVSEDEMREWLHL